MSTAILDARNVTKHFGAVTAASNVTATIESGSVVGLIGTNGAGKTTFVNMLTGYVKPDAGAIHYDGRDITALAPRQITRIGICRSFQTPQLYDSLTAHENILIGLGIVGMNAGRSDMQADDVAADRLLERFGLAPYRDRRASVLPGGVRKLLDIAMAMAAQPRVLLLDEPTSGVSAEEKLGIMEMVMTGVRAAGATVLFVEHDMDVVSRYAERVLVFYDGRIIADAPPAVALADAEVRRHVVGTGAGRARDERHA